uniref:NB-ARC domain-containing protein n=1 Tax=Leersia perrieri TaxID=77586 RepID=A0A0D9XS73_9ORYZ
MDGIGLYRRSSPTNFRILYLERQRRREDARGHGGVASRARGGSGAQEPSAGKAASYEQELRVTTRMAGIFASLAVNKALDKLASFLPKSSSLTAAKERQEKDLDDLKMLERTMRRIHATLQDAEQHWDIREESSKLRLRELKDLAYEAEDVVEEYEYELKLCNAKALLSYLKAAPTTSGSDSRQSMVAVPDELAVKTRKLIEKFQEIQCYSDNFSLSENDGERRLAPDIGCSWKTSSVVFEQSILGRENDKEFIVQKLLSIGDDNVADPLYVMAIVGMGGLGKTTLAQLTYNNPRVSSSFNDRAWVCVSDQFDVSNITRCIIAAVKREKCDLSELCDLQEVLQDEIKGKKILIVLDDVWIERTDCWELFFMPMRRTKLCTIIVTTRSEKVAELMPTRTDFYNLDCLDHDESWLLFTKVAFTIDQGNVPLGLVEIGRAIVQKCKGLPLAIKTLGSMLRYETAEERWREVLDSKLWDLEQARNEVLPSLELSYKHMPIYLKRCLVSLSLYPKDYDINELEVIELWNYLISFKVIEMMTSMQLEAKNFNGFDDDDQHIMHDLIHDLACFLSTGEFFRLDGDTFVEIPQKARYISIQDGASGKISVAPPSLRAILVLPRATVYIDNPKELFSNCEKLRVLVLDQHRLGPALPDFMGRLKLLRHLKFESLEEADIDDPSFRPYMYHIKGLHEIRCLMNLHTLPPIHFTHIKELRSLNEIRELTITGLGVGLNIDDAKEALLHTKRHLQFLRLDFDNYSEEMVWISYDSPNNNQNLQLLECLRPHCSLEELIITDYKSPKYPSWLGDSSFMNLTQVMLSSCRSQCLPTLGHLRSLMFLHFHNMPLVQHIGQEFCSHSPSVKEGSFPSLEELVFNEMTVCSEWSEVNNCTFPCLCTLKICRAYRLMSLPLVPFMSLTSLELDKCYSLTKIPASPRLRKLRIRWYDHFDELSAVLPINDPLLSKPLPSLEGLLLNNPLPIATTSISIEPQHLPLLRKLHLSCDNLQYCDRLTELSCLDELKLLGCPKFPPIPGSLRQQLQTLLGGLKILKKLISKNI